MDWIRIRKHYRQHVRAAKDERGVTQTDIATIGGLSGQSAVARITTMGGSGPTVENFVKAVRGLGLDVSAFFAEIEAIERQHRVPPSTSLSPSTIALSEADNAPRSALSSEGILDTFSGISRGDADPTRFANIERQLGDLRARLDALVATPPTTDHVSTQQPMPAATSADAVSRARAARVKRRRRIA